MGGNSNTPATPATPVQMQQMYMVDAQADLAKSGINVDFAKMTDQSITEPGGLRDQLEQMASSMIAKLPDQGLDVTREEKGATKDSQTLNNFLESIQKPNLTVADLQSSAHDAYRDLYNSKNFSADDIAPFDDVESGIDAKQNLSNPQWLAAQSAQPATAAPAAPQATPPPTAPPITAPRTPSGQLAP